MLAELHFPERDDGCRRDRSDRAYLNIIGVISNLVYVVGWTGLPPVDPMVYQGIVWACICWWGLLAWYSEHAWHLVTASFISLLIADQYMQSLALLMHPYTPRWLGCRRESLQVSGQGKWWCSCSWRVCNYKLWVLHGSSSNLWWVWEPVLLCGTLQVQPVWHSIHYYIKFCVSWNCAYLSQLILMVASRFIYSSSIANNWNSSGSAPFALR